MDTKEKSLRWREQAEHLASSLPPLLAQADRVAHTIIQGMHGRRRTGVGEAFWQFRHYLPGDMSNRIDWRKSARSDTLLIRENEWEAANTVWIWCDRSASMDFQSSLAKTTKSDRAILLSLALAILLVRGGERIGILGSNLGPDTGQRIIRRLATVLLNSPEAEDPALLSLPPRAEMPRFSSAVFLSDFLEPVDQLVDRLSTLAAPDVRGHLIQILDPAEETLPYYGRTEFSGMEDDARLTVGKAESLQSEFADKMSEHRARVASLAHRLGWTYSLHRTDETAQSALLKIYGVLGDNLALRGVIGSGAAHLNATTGGH
jgi:uncharacterized protein (DUF58 family)